MPSAVCPAARCWDRHRPTPLPDGRSWAGAGAGAGARAGAGRWGCGAPWREEASGRAALGTPAVENGSAPLHGSGLTATPGKDSWKHRSLFLEAAFPPDRHDGTAPALSDLRCSCIPSRSSGSAALLPRNLGPVAWRAPFDANCLLGCVHPQEDRDDSLLPEHFRAEWCLASKCGLSLQCLISASYLPEAVSQRKWPSKGMIFCFTQSLLSWGCFFCFLSSILFLPSPLQNKKDHTSHQDLSSWGILFFFSFWQLSFHKEKKYISFFNIIVFCFEYFDIVTVMK